MQALINGKMAKQRLYSRRKVLGGAAATALRHNGDKARWEERQRAYPILYEAQQYWMAMSKFRRDRARNINYAYGRQWDDYIEVDGRKVREEDFIRQQGNVPLKNNVVRRMVQSILGVYRSQAKEPTCTARDRSEQRYGEIMSTVLQYNMQLNHMSEVNARCMEEFLISGFVVQRKTYGWRRGVLDCWTDYVQPNNFFIDCNMRDFRGWDVSCVGEVHDLDFNTVCEHYCRRPSDRRKLADIYGMASSRHALRDAYERFGYPLKQGCDFLVPRSPQRCRVIEVWRKESKPRYRCHDVNSGEIFKVEEKDLEQNVLAVNRERLNTAAEFGIATDDVPLIEYEWFMDNHWRYYHMTPFGDILEEGDSPYEHGEHPYVFRAYPFIDGEIHSYVSNVIDQQRYINRLIMMHDMIVRSSAKGLLMFPEECIPKGMTIEDISRQWARVDGVIMIKQPTTGVALPQQIASNCTNIGINELLGMQMKLFEDISGVNGALQGKPGFSGMSASLYSQQTQNATTALLDLLETFSDFIKEGARKDVKNIQQYYEPERWNKIAGVNASESHPERVADIDFDLSITESTATPSYRAIANDMLMQLWSAQAITVEQMLEHGNFPFGDELLQSIKAQKEEAAKAAAAQGGMQGAGGGGAEVLTGLV